MTSPVQVALRELMILTKCYCDGQYDGIGHPRLGHNCSFRPDVVRVVEAIGGALKLCDDELAGGGSDPWSHPSPFAEAIRATLLGLPADEDDPPWNQDEGSRVPGSDAPAHSALIAQKLQRDVGQTAEGGPPSG